MSKENVWIIGDVQGCYCHLKKLLSQNEIAQNSNSQLWFAGDIVNRGSDSLKTIEQIMNLGNRATCVLGNHDINLLAIFAGIKEVSKSDTLADILNSPNINNIIEWLRFKPLAHFEYNCLMVHAGVIAQWDIKKTISLASEVEELLRSPHWKYHIKKLFNNRNTAWSDNLTGEERINTIANALTRIRFCNPDGSMNFTQKKSPEKLKNKQLIPWFNLENRATKNNTIVFGHWSSLGLMIKNHIICLDTGCVWGKYLTAMRLHDRKIIQISCKDLQKNS
ncbi:bis(5'-nucleosyl)-tetraphosphatase (symmetrical) [Candidatus Kinetoplastibacterium desouzaii TCC079E]|uniref:bis(5'-nucleosyl)-tetraphosphatase (symmetrical) n=1 Tax=Candidatus Kinetoplastidibacterium desouzai TCC079E TaxID=1208919 RepID=M1LST6_9PROT|nr:symmetrical bis(5'-nucleosyl)-tetraphosphatase [Candidatus Kinetoplastibacterium desouzaii]AGF47171.1 bis(5'-nucleosyl)-tetraphosphatase (symmetrical) [Candidatus Kinetoplastibacterium desouzaii TCC079E]